jgi:hypothetical protein
MTDSSLLIDGGTLLFDIEKSSRIQMIAIDARTGEMLSEFFVGSDASGHVFANLPAFNGEIVIYAKASAADSERPSVVPTGGCAVRGGSEPVSWTWNGGVLALLCAMIRARRRVLRCELM